VVLAGLVLLASGLLGVSPASARGPLPAGRNPSLISQMVCRPKAQREIAGVLGLTARVSRPTWIDHLYSCRYQYRNGAFALSVKELSSWSATRDYFANLGRQLGNTQSVSGLGQGAFETADGSLVVRKDYKVLLVDISGLPAQFGRPPTSASDVGNTIGDLILGCWSGD
jgi:hypothetical protein